MYPSFEPVRIHIAKVKGGYRVHDGGGVMQAAWDHGRDIAAAGRAVGRHASINSLQSVEGQLAVDVPSEDWLVSAILSIANASAAAAADAIDAAVPAHSTFADRVEEVIKGIVLPSHLVRDYEVRGRSGKRYSFDFALRGASRRWLIVQTIVPHPASVSSKYVAFSDTRDAEEAEPRGLAVYESPLDDGDAALMRQVADLVPFTSLDSGIRAEISR